MATLDTLESSVTSAPKGITRRTWILFAAVVVMLGASIWYLRLPTRLTAEESRLVGTWTLGLPPNPPSNAVEQIFELRSDRSIYTYGRPVATGIKTKGNRGAWRLEGGMLIWNITTTDYAKRIHLFMDGRSASHESRMRYLGIEGDSFFVETTNGSKAPFHRYSNDP